MIACLHVFLVFQYINSFKVSNLEFIHFLHKNVSDYLISSTSINESHTDSFLFVLFQNFLPTFMGIISSIILTYMKCKLHEGNDFGRLVLSALFPAPRTVSASE